MKSYNTIKLNKDEDTTQELASENDSFVADFIDYMHNHTIQDEDIYDIVPTPKRKKINIQKEEFWAKFPPLW